MIDNLFDHPLGTPDWELTPASPVQTSSRSVWAPSSDGTGRNRMTVARGVRGLGGPLRLRRLGLRRGIGYHKCASDREFDAPKAVRLLAQRQGAMEEVLAAELTELPGEEEVVWFDIDVESYFAAAFIEESFIDGQWPSWNLSRSGLILSGEVTAPWRRAPHHMLDIGMGREGPLPHGVSRIVSNDQVRFATPYLEIGFRLRSPNLSYLAIDEEGRGATGRDLLQHGRSMDIVRAGFYPAGVYPVLRDELSDYLAQGPRIGLIDGRGAGGFKGFDVSGMVHVEGNRVIYDIELGLTGVRYRLSWTVKPDEVSLDLRRDGSSEPAPAWTSSAWHLATNNKVAASTLLGSLVEEGETGLVSSPATWHFPGHGSLVVESSPEVLLRSDSVRPLDTNTLEVKVGETPQSDGTYRLSEGAEGSISFRVDTPRLAQVSADAPDVVKSAVERRWVTGLTYRADTATFSNNGASMHCVGSLNPLADIVTAHPRGICGIDPVGFLASSVSRWLRRAPGYGSGHTSRGDFSIEDEYLMLAADGLYATGRLLHLVDEEWFESHSSLIEDAWNAMRRRDLDTDGLVESERRRGISEEHEWSTTWADVISFGWKDAWTNAVLYAAIGATVDGLERFGRHGFAEDLRAWAETLRESYQVFLNESTGWVSGWISADGRMHDYCFPLINGDAVAHGLFDFEQAHRIMSQVWAEFENTGYDDFANGIPINLHPVSEEDIGGVVFGLPIGGYIQGGATHHRTGGFVAALYRVGMRDEGDAVLEGLSRSVTDATVFGGVGSGVDWRFWDGSPSGYEGLLAEGFGFLAEAVKRYSSGDD